jgi:ATP-dependent Lhr-like helicase
VIPLDSPDWQDRYRVELPRSGALWLSCAAGDRSALGRAMARIPALAVDADVLRVYGTVTQVVRHGADFHMRVELRGVGG